MWTAVWRKAWTCYLLGGGVWVERGHEIKKWRPYTRCGRWPKLKGRWRSGNPIHISAGPCKRQNSKPKMERTTRDVTEVWRAQGGQTHTCEAWHKRKKTCEGDTKDARDVVHARRARRNSRVWEFKTRTGPGGNMWVVLQKLSHFKCMKF